EDAYKDTLFEVPKSQVKNIGNQILDQAYKNGVLDRDYAYTPSRIIYLRDGKELQELRYENFYTDERIFELVEETLNEKKLDNIEVYLKKIIARSIVPTVKIDQELTDNVLDSQIQSINPNTGVVEKGSLIIAKGEVVEGDVLRALISLETQYKSQVWSESNQKWIIIGYVLLISIVFLMLFLFLKKFRPVIYED